MSAPIIWIVFPVLISIGFWFIQEKRRLLLSLAVALCGLLAVIAIVQPIGAVMKLGPISIEIMTTLAIFGRALVLENSDRFFLAFINLAAIFWFVGSYIVNAPTKFIPLSLSILGLLTAALAVEPFLYSAIFVELTAIVTIPLLTLPNRPVGKGTMRFLIYQSLALPFILLAGWILSGAQANPSDASQLNLAALFLGLGFSFWLGVFPFHVWIPELSEETHSYIAGFLLSILPVVFILIMLNFLNGIIWLKDASFLVPVLRVVGVVMVVSGGLGAAIQKDLRRLFGFAVIFESGFAILAISLQNSIGNQSFYISFIPRIIQLGLLALSLTIFRKANIMPDLLHIKGQFRNHPITASALLVSLFSIAGFPLLAGFPIKIELIEQFSNNPLIVVWSILGMSAILFSAVRILILLITKTDENQKNIETTGEIVLLSVGVFCIIIMGILPNIFVGSTWTAISRLLGLE